MHSFNPTLAKEPQLHYEELDFVYLEQYLVDLSFIREAPKEWCDKAYMTLEQYDQIEWDYGFCLADEMRGFIKNVEMIKEAVMEWFLGLTDREQDHVQVDPYICIPDAKYLPCDLEDSHNEVIA